MLARRLINQQSISIDAEEFMVAKLKVFEIKFFKDYFIENEREFFKDKFHIELKQKRNSIFIFMWKDFVH